MKARKKILFLMPSLTGGGAERVFTILLRHLDRSRFEPHLAVLQMKGAYTAELPADVVIHDLNVTRVRYALPGIVRLIWRTKPDAVLSTLGHLNLGLILSRILLPARTKLLVREASTASVAAREETWHPALWRWLYRHLYRRADMIVCLSDHMLKDMVDSFGLPREKMVRIYNPVDRKRLDELAESGKNPYSGLGHGPNLVAAGRLSREKGFDVLLNAMVRVLDSIPSARLTILGEGPLRKQLTEQIERLRLGRAVSMPGFQENPWPFLRHADLFVLSSRYEGLPNVMLEALALGAPVVATDCPGAVREIHNGVQGILLVPPEEPAALAQAVISMCCTVRSREERIEGAREFLSRFDPQTAVMGYSSLF